MFDIFGTKRREEERRRREVEAQRHSGSSDAGAYPYTPVYDSAGPAYTASSNEACSSGHSDSGSSCTGGDSGGGGGGGD